MTDEINGIFAVMLKKTGLKMSNTLGSKHIMFRIFLYFLLLTSVTPVASADKIVESCTNAYGLASSRAYVYVDEIGIAVTEATPVNGKRNFIIGYQINEARWQPTLGQTAMNHQISVNTNVPTYSTSVSESELKAKLTDELLFDSNVDVLTAIVKATNPLTYQSKQQSTDAYAKAQTLAASLVKVFRSTDNTTIMTQTIDGGIPSITPSIPGNHLITIYIDEGVIETTMAEGAPFLTIRALRYKDKFCARFAESHSATNPRSATEQ